MPGIPKQDLIKAKKFVATVLAERPEVVAGQNNKPSAIKLSDLLKDETGIIITRKAMTRWLKEDMSKYLEISTLDNNSQIKEYDTLMNSAKSIWNNPDAKPSDRTKAYNSYLKAKKQREELISRLTDEKLRQASVERPVYLVKFNPGSAKRKCPRCGNEFYEMDEKSKEKAEDQTTKDNTSK